VDVECLSVRPNAWRGLFQVVIACFLLPMLSPSLDACSCMAPPACTLPGEYPLVFVGKVARKKVAGTQGPNGIPITTPSAVVTFEVAEYLRGQQGPQIDIHTTEGCCACGYTFVVGLDYLVFASGNAALTTSTCSPTQPLRTAAALIEQLRSVALDTSPAQIFGFVGLAPWDPRTEAADRTQPLDGIPVRAIGMEKTFETTTSRAGAYAFHDLPPDQYRVGAMLPSGMTSGEAAFGRAGSSLELGPNTRGCQANFRVLSNGRISGLVVNGKGEPRRAYVGAIRVDDRPESPLGALSSDTTSGDGRFSLPLLPAGRYYLVYAPEIAGKIDYQHRIYYPGTLVPAEANVVELELGEHVDSIRIVVPD